MLVCLRLEGKHTFGPINPTFSAILILILSFTYCLSCLFDGFNLNENSPKKIELKVLS